MDINVLILELLENNIEKIIGYLGNKIGTEFKKGQIKFKKGFQRYLETSYNKYSKVKTILYSDEPVDLYDFFICNDLENNKYVIDISSTVVDLLKVSHYIFIIGSGGVGKSMLMRHILIRTIKDKIYIPILIELRNFSEYGGELEDFIFYSLKELNFNYEKEYFDFALSTGCFVFLFDGLDEVKSNRYSKLCKGIDYLCTQYNNNYFIITSRPNDSCESLFQQFTVFRCMDFTKDQAIEMIDKLYYDKDIKFKFIEYLKEKLYEYHKTFASNPLLLTILLMTYHEYAEIPDKLHLFYSYAFDTLYTKHDARKGLKREFYSDLSVDDFKLVLATFCMKTYIKEVYEFTSDEIKKIIGEILNRKVQSRTTSDDYINDLCTSVCILIKEGVRYRFSHRSFQEYFTAFCIRDLSDELLIKICNYLILDNQTQILQDNMIVMLYDMIPERFEICVLIQIIEKIELDISEDKELFYAKLLFPRIKMDFYDDIFIGFDISCSNSAINKLLFTAIKRNSNNNQNTRLMSDKAFWIEMKSKHIKITDPMKDILSQDYSDIFMNSFLSTRMGQIVKDASCLKSKIQNKYKEEVYLLENLLT